MGAGASTNATHRRRALIRWHNQHAPFSLTTQLRLAFEDSEAGSVDQPGLATTQDIAHVLERHFCLPLSYTLDQVRQALRALGCDYNASTDSYSVHQVVAYFAPSNALPSEHAARQSIHAACKAGDLTAVVAAVAINPTAWHELDAFGNLPLYYASLCGHLKCVSWLLTKYSEESSSPDASRPSLSDADRLRCATNALNPHVRAILACADPIQKHAVLSPPQLNTCTDDDQDDSEQWGCALASMFDS